MPRPKSPKGNEPLYRYEGATSARTKSPEPEMGWLRIGLVAVACLAVTGVAMAWNPPARSAHKFTEASDYNAERDSGCVNSGKGCHGTESSYTDFNAYHGDMECTSCHDYQGVGCLPCHSPKNTECPTCHDGSTEGISDRVRLSDPYPKGHYRETSHTAMGTNMKRRMVGAPGGRARAQCRDCHSRALMGSHTEVAAVPDSPYGSMLGCGDCHNDVRSFGQAEVLSDWKNRACEDCHKLGSSAPMHEVRVAGKAKSRDLTGCTRTGAGCHDVNDLHALHPDRPVNCSKKKGSAEKACHDFSVEAAVPSVTGCGEGSKGCHTRYVNDDYSHEQDEALHSPTNSTLARNTSFYSTGCGECHLAEPNGISLIDEHERTTSEGSQDPCLGCHNDLASIETIVGDWPSRDTAGACDDCHGREELDAPHAGDIVAAHEGDASAGCAESGAGCHPTADLSQVGAPTVSANLHKSCVRCHDATPSDGNVTYDPSKKSCGQGGDCHGAQGDYDPDTDVHAGSNTRIDGADARHDAGSAMASAVSVDEVSGVSSACGDCHDRELGTEHIRPNSAIATGADTACTRCHNATATASAVVKDGWPKSGAVDACSNCHGAAGAPAPHTQMDPAHEGNEVAADGSFKLGACGGSGCHETAELRVLHKKSGCLTLGCHAATGDIRGLGIRTCGGDSYEHACHVGYSATGGHEDSGGHKGVELNVSGDPTPGFCVKSGCHTTVDLKMLHGSEGCDDEGCHNLATTIGVKACGGTNPDTACHNAFSTTEHFVDHSGDVTGTVNGITYGAGTNVGCFGCHNASLYTEHMGTDASDITGGGANNCRVCHYNSADPGSGAYSDLPAVKAAIAARDRRCVTCHASGSSMPNATSAASPHKNTSTANELPPGRVWADPFAEWKAAFDSPMGGGHNALPSSLVGGVTRQFPLTTYTFGNTTYTWALPPNTGTTTWLRSSAFGGASLDTTEAITHLTVTCADCHVIPDDMAGPHGAAVQVWIDPEYSQTEYSNPSRRLESQFGGTGTERVVCMKCHNLEFGSVPGTTSPGGNPVHAQHASHPGFPAWNPQRYGDACVDCHIRIPHAWRNPRLLAKTVSDGVTPADTPPYLLERHDGLAGIILRDIQEPSDLDRTTCVTGGCHGRSETTDHPEPSDVPSATYWP